MKFKRRHVFLIVALIAGAVLIFTLFGHIYVTRTVTTGLCKELKLMYCVKGSRLRYDSFEQHRMIFFWIATSLVGVSLIGFVIAFFEDVKRQIRSKTEDTE